MTEVGKTKSISLAWADATEQADWVRSGAISALELVDASIARIELINPQINAVIHERFEKARDECANIVPGSPFSGVPIVLKDWGCQSANDPYHAGSRFLRRIGWRAAHDSIVASRLRRAGFIILGRTNTPEFAMSTTTEPLAYGPTRNPWNLKYSSGGSSGGSAAAVAAGLVPVAHANDVGGSIRIPASACGVVGLKPTRGRVDYGTNAPAAWGGALIDHAVTRTVRDSAGILDVLAKHTSDGSGYRSPTREPAYASEIGDNRQTAPLQVGILDHVLVDGSWIDPECVSAVQTTGLLLEGLGHHVEKRYPPALGDPQFPIHFRNLVSTWCAAEVDGLYALTGQVPLDSELEDHTLATRNRGRTLSAPEYLSSLAWLAEFEKRVSSWWVENDLDILVTPILTAPPQPIGSSAVRAQLISTSDLIQYLRQFSATGNPAISLPLHWTADGLPVGVQLVARYGREDLLFRVSAQLELAKPWAERRPDSYG